MTATNAGGDPVIAIVDGVAADLEAAQERLTQLDSALGDGGTRVGHERAVPAFHFPWNKESWW